MFEPSIMNVNHTHNHFTALFPGLPGWVGGRRSLLLEFVMQGKITEADTPTIRLGATPSGLITEPPPSSPHFYTGYPSCCNPPTLSWLGTGIKYAGVHAQLRDSVMNVNTTLKCGIKRSIIFIYYIVVVAFEQFVFFLFTWRLLHWTEHMADCSSKIYKGATHLPFWTTKTKTKNCFGCA